MASKRSQRYKKMAQNTRGINDFLIVAILLAMLCVWAIRDGWYPSKKTQENHPLHVELEFAEAGRVAELMYQRGDKYAANSALIRLDVTRLEEEFSKAQQELGRIESELAEIAAEATDTDEVARLRLLRTEVVQRVGGLRQSMATRTLRAPDKAGVLLEYMVDVGDFVEPGQPGVAVRPSTYFYSFNKSLALLSFIGAIIALIAHLRVR